MSNNIKISPNHGLNPSIPVCFWCGKEKNEIALLGKIDRKDSEAPRKIITDYEPCDSCKEIFNKGIHVIGVTTEPIMQNMMPMVVREDGNLYPTGSMFVGTEDWLQRFLTANNATDMIDNVLEKKVLLMPDEQVTAFINDIKLAEVPEMDVENLEESTDENNDN